jgi:hypothetical protein
MTPLAFFGLIFAAIAGALTAFARQYKIGPFMPSLDRIPDDTPYVPASVPPVMAPTATTTPPITNPTETKTTEPPALLWDTPKQAFHSTRVLCDIHELTYDQKNIVCACIFRESEFNNNAIGRNKDPKTGKVWSTDWGIVQVNDTKGWHIGKGLRFSSVEDVLANPEKGVLWMIEEMKTTGRLQPWSSYTTKTYTQFLPKTSRMWNLAV